MSQTNMQRDCELVEVGGHNKDANVSAPFGERIKGDIVKHAITTNM